MSDSKSEDMGSIPVAPAKLKRYKMIDIDETGIKRESTLDLIQSGFNIKGENENGNTENV